MMLAEKNIRLSPVLFLTFVVITLLSGYLISYGLIDIKSIVILLAGIVSTALLFKNERTRWILFCFGLASTFLGHRAIYVGYWSFFIPLELIIWFLMGAVLFTNASKRQDQQKNIPFSLIFITLWIILRAFFAVVFGDDWDATLAWVSPFMLCIAAFYVVRSLVKTQEQLVVTLRIMMVVSGLMSGVALVEYFFPSFANSIPWYFSNSIKIDTFEGFLRAPFSFWGYPAGAAIVVWGIIIAYDEILDKKTSWRWISIFIAVIGIAAVYISGQRSSWIGFALAFLILNLRFGAPGLFASAIILGLTNYLPSTFWARLLTVYEIVGKGIITDTSTIQRLSRWTWALDTIKNHPVAGIGFGYWASHNVLLELGSKVGVIPAVIFIIFLFQLIFRISKVALYRNSADARRYGWLFMALAVTWLVQMSVEIVLFNPVFSAPHWVLLALGWYLPDILKLETGSKNSYQNRLLRIKS